MKSALKKITGLLTLALMLITMEGGVNANEDKNSINNTAPCRSFYEFSDFLIKTIEKPDLQNVMKMNPYVITSFNWKREQEEPFIKYPVTKGIVAYYDKPYLPKHLSKKIIVPIIKKNAEIISEKIDQKAGELGFVPDPLNTLPFRTLLNGDVLQVFAFKKGDDLYSLVMKADGGEQAPAVGTVMLTCGKAIPDFDNVYNALNLKLDPNLKNDYEDSVAIADVSPDKKVYAVIESDNRMKTAAEYYYFNENQLKLVSEGSYPAKCESLETLKIGKGMRCVDENDQRTVSY